MAAKKRIDPETRAIDGTAPYFSMKNKDPNRVYVLVPKTNQEMLDTYEYLGYETEVSHDGGPAFTMGKKAQNGVVLERRGHVLMSMEKAAWEELRDNGPDGVSGQKMADRVQEKMFNGKMAVTDLMRGIDYRHQGQPAFYLESEKGSVAVGVNE